MQRTKRCHWSVSRKGGLTKLAVWKDHLGSSVENQWMMLGGWADECREPFFRWEGSEMLMFAKNHTTPNLETRSSTLFFIFQLHWGIIDKWNHNIFNYTVSFFKQLSDLSDIEASRLGGSWTPLGFYWQLITFSLAKFMFGHTKLTHF